MPRNAKNSAGNSSRLVDRQLARYREMRNFDLTSEPSGGAQPSHGKPGPGRANKLPFVVQKHAATRLHYDFRLGLHGVLKSWAVTKGPSYVPADKRLAVEVEDHPIEYGGFEGTIPKGQYGGGTVMLWDEGDWEPLGDPDEGLAKGNLKFILHGRKLQGKWALIRMGGRAARENKPNWLLIKEHDQYARKPGDPPITEEAPNSVATRRDLEAIAHDEDHVWQSNGREAASGAKASAAEKTPARKLAPPGRGRNLPGEKEKLPAFIPPQLASEASQPPPGADWIHELKLDGYRIQARIEHAPGISSAVRLLTRRGLDWTHRMPAIARDLAQLKVQSAILDGEVVVIAESGQTSFARLQAAFDENQPEPLSYYVFDLLDLDGHNLRGQPLLERKRLLAELLAALPPGASARLSQHIEANGEALFREACRLGAEGVVSKRRSAPYVSGRGSSWVKVKCFRRQEFVIGGFTLPANRSHGVGALLLGYYEDGRLRYAGRTGTGFTQASSRMLRESLEALRRENSPFAEVPAAQRRGAVWTDPKIVAEVQFHTWTADSQLRQASFKGLRQDKLPSEVHREEADEKPDPALGKRLDAGERKAETRGTKPASDHAAPSSRWGLSSPSRPLSPSLRSLRVTHPDRVVDPETKLTKKALVDYYWAVAQGMLPHVAGRPLSLVRCPDGAGKECFFQKHLAEGMPRGVEGIGVRGKDGKEETYVTLSTAEALAGLAQMNVLEVHPWGSTNADLDHPDRLIFDLDPDDAVSWPTLCDSAIEVRERLKRLGVKSFLKTTGGKGLHVVAPIRPDRAWDAVKAWTQAFALQMESDNSKLYISKMTKSARKNKIFIDYMRNERGATAIAPYSPRARLGLAAAVPLSWSELKLPERPRFTVAGFAGWSSRLRRDPWKAMAGLDQRLP